MFNDLTSILGLAFIGSVAGIIGGVVLIVKESWAGILCKYAMPFAAGVLLSVSILHLVPEAVRETGEIAYLYVLIAFLASFLFEQYFATLHHHEDRKTTMHKASVPLVIVGDTIHNFIDGVTIAAAYLTNPAFGLVIALATFLHETPHEIGDFGVLMSAGWTKTKTFFANLFSASATFPGALFVYFFVSQAEQSMGVLLAISAGVFLYLGASDFLPEVEEEHQKTRSWKKILLVFLGAGIMYALTFISPEY